jgi:hypothetical protein
VSAQPTLVVFLGGLGGSPVEQMVGSARTAAALDSIEAALASGAYAGAILATDDVSLRVDLPSVTLDVDQEPFRFGHRLAGVIRRHRIESVVYMSGGSVPLFEEDDFAQLARALKRNGAAVTNNSFSSDLVAFPVDERTFPAIESLARDNGLARALAEGADLTVQELPRSLATQMDIDAPTDLAVLSLAGIAFERTCTLSI